MKIGVSLTRVGVNMGDHAQDIITHHEVAEGETVESLVERLLYDDSWAYDVPNKIAATRQPKHEWYLTVHVTEPAPPDAAGCCYRGPECVCKDKTP